MTTIASYRKSLRAPATRAALADDIASMHPGESFRAYHSAVEKITRGGFEVILPWGEVTYTDSALGAAHAVLIAAGKLDNPFGRRHGLL